MECPKLMSNALGRSEGLRTSWLFLKRKTYRHHCLHNVFLSFSTMSYKLFLFMLQITQRPKMHCRFFVFSLFSNNSNLGFGNERRIYKYKHSFSQCCSSLLRFRFWPPQFPSGSQRDRSIVKHIRWEWSRSI